MHREFYGFIPVVGDKYARKTISGKCYKLFNITIDLLITGKIQTGLEFCRCILQRMFLYETSVGGVWNIGFGFNLNKKSDQGNVLVFPSIVTFMATNLEIFG